MHSVCHYSICGLQYGYASILSILGQLSLLYLSFFIAYRKLAISEYLLPSILLVNICLFLTPVGLSWFERGQFSVYVGLAYLWLIAGIIARNPFYLVFSALMAYFKWTSFPFVGVVVAVWVLRSRNLEEFKATSLLAMLVPATIAVLFLSNVTDGIAFLNGALGQDLNAHPVELSLGLLLPTYLVKLLPAVLVVLGYLFARKHKGDFVALMPFLVGAGILSVLYPTWAFDYSTPCLLGFIPLLIYWAKLARPAWQGRATIYFFCAFLLLASTFHIFVDRYSLPETSTIYLYIACAVVLMGLSLRRTPG